MSFLLGLAVKVLVSLVTSVGATYGRLTVERLERRKHREDFEDV